MFVTSEPDEAASHRSRLDARTYVRHVEIAGPEAARDVGSTKFMRAAAPYVDSLIEDSLRDVRRRRWRQAQEETS